MNAAKLSISSRRRQQFFSSGVEGTLILVAAVSIAVAAIGRLVTPKPLEQVGTGLAVSVLAALVNLSIALILLRAAKRYQSITLRANAHHLLTDVWTSAGVLVGVAAVDLTDLAVLDPIAALVVAANISWSGVRIVRESISGLMDTALPTHERDTIHKILELQRQSGVEYHAFRTRQSGAHKFVSLHVLVPGDWTVRRGHQQLELIEADIRSTLPNVSVFTHLEPVDDPLSWDGLD
jgi:cation diffusion facilitator family transporter